MDKTRLPQHVLNRIEQRWTARLAQMLEEKRRPERTPSSPAFFTRRRELRSNSITASSAAAGDL
jgi:hypothetical protein